ncbi:hypothetical protein ACFWGI_37985 [Streptomyces niveus]|uniref:hypothetical protein n=1 Tax=Streptomyces niveus TaxID=193462 RepID=UPI00365442AC
MTAQRADDPAPLTDQDVYRAEQLRAELQDFWGTSHRGSPLGAHLTQSLLISRSDISHRPELAEAHITTMCRDISRAYDNSTVWAAPHTMTRAITEHPLLATTDIDAVISARLVPALVALEEAAPARDGLIYFPYPVESLSAHPIHALAWHMHGGANSNTPVSLDVHTMTRTALIPTLLPPSAQPRHLATTRLSTNSITILGSPTSTPIAMGDPRMWGAPAPETALILLLAFWLLRPPQDQEFERSTPQRANKSKKKGKGARPKNRRVRVIHENAFARSAAEPVGATHHWNDDTLRWRVEEAWQWRCPNPHAHRQIIESGGTCPKVKVKVKAHQNGPKGRALDTRRTVRIPTTKPDSPASDDG